MTILNCQKRHHEPHTVSAIDPVAGAWSTRCDGLPRWPHNRPKPPRVADWDAYCPYLGDHNTVTVVNVGDWWLVEWEGPNARYQAVSFLKNEWQTAITYAQKVAQEKSQT